MSRKKEPTCMIEGCTKEVYCTDLCINCYQGLRYWQQGKTPKDVVRRKQQLQVLEARMNLLMPAKVNTIRSKKRRVA